MPPNPQPRPTFTPQIIRVVLSVFGLWLLIVGRDLHGAEAAPPAAGKAPAAPLRKTTISASPTSTSTADPVDSGVPLRLLNREIFTFRGAFGPYQPAQRAAAAAALIEGVKPMPGTKRVMAQPVGTNSEMRVYGQAVFYVTPGDVFEIRGETFDSLVERTLQQLDTVLAEREELGNSRIIAASVAKGVFGTALLAALIWLLARNRRWLESRLIRLTADRADQLKSHTLRVLGLQNLVPLLRGLMTTVFWTVVVLVTYLWLEYLLLLFPNTRPFGEELGVRFFDLLGRLAQSLVGALPNIGIVAFVWFVARFASSAVRRFFAAVASGRIHSNVFDPATTPITQRLCVMMIWITAIIVAFPYIPGSQTPAFQGISVLAGLMISLGSGSVVAQLVGGLILVYNRTCRAGDYVRIGEHEGTLTTIGFFSSRLVTSRNEEVVLPNNQISGGALINYSRLNATEGVTVPVQVSIGYTTPWRQVHAMLLEAARRTPGVRWQPAPCVRQNSLEDFYVVYQLNAILETPAHRTRVLSELHAHIQDVFNEYGVQIMSPHYEADPSQPAIVPKDRWHLPPASPPQTQ